MDARKRKVRGSHVPLVCLTKCTANESLLQLVSKKRVSAKLFLNQNMSHTIWKVFYVLNFLTFQKNLPFPQAKWHRVLHKSVWSRSFRHKGISVRRSCSPRLLLSEICKCKSVPVKLSAWEQLSSNTNSSFLTVISSKWSYPSGVYYNFLTSLRFSFINHRSTWISLNFLFSNACHWYTFRINGLTVVLFS